MSSNPSAVRCKELRLSFSNRDALAGIDLEVAANEVFGLVGPNGSGKTTLFRILATLLRPSSGVAEVFGNDVVRAATDVRRSIGVVFQMPSLDAKLRVLENLEFHGRLFGLRGSALRDRCSHLLATFGIADRAQDVVGTLSGGLARRVEIAKGMMSRPRLLLLDEPSTGLDPAARRDLRQAIARVRDDEGTTVFWTTHLLDEAETCDRIAILDQGRVIALGSPQRLMDEEKGAIVTVKLRDGKRPESFSIADFGLEPETVGSSLRFVTESTRAAHDFAASLTRQLEDELATVTIGRPSLEDVFFARTGKVFEVGAAAATKPRGGRHG